MAQGPAGGQVRDSGIMDLKVEIDPHSGFCGGVIRAIGSAEKFLDGSSRPLYSLGSIVHNEAELRRLGERGLRIIGLDDLGRLPEGSDVLIRAHGEPPATYEAASRAGIRLIDCTCPVVLQLQKSIAAAYKSGSQVIIFGKPGHAEVLGLVGQVGGDALVVADMEMLCNAISEGKVRREGPVDIFSQTTKSPSEYDKVCTAVREALLPHAVLNVHHTICRQVGSRYEQLSAFASSHSVVVFVAGKDSSNGRVLSDLCRKVNPRTYNVLSENDVDASWFRDGDDVGVAGATSTPKWLLDSVAEKILQLS